jgi:uncharacterized integral membrane protein
MLTVHNTIGIELGFLQASAEGPLGVGALVDHRGGGLASSRTPL